MKKFNYIRYLKHIIFQGKTFLFSFLIFIIPFSIAACLLENGLIMLSDNPPTEISPIVAFGHNIYFSTFPLIAVISVGLAVAYDLTNNSKEIFKPDSFFYDEIPPVKQ